MPNDKAVITRNVRIGSVVAKPYTGEGTFQSPIKVQEQYLSNFETFGDKFRKNVFEAFIHAAVRPDLSCYFKFTAGLEMIYKLSLDTRPDLVFSVAEFAWEIEASKVLNHKVQQARVMDIVFTVGPVDEMHLRESSNKY